MYSTAATLLGDIGRIYFTGKHPPNIRSPEFRGVPEGQNTSLLENPAMKR